MAEEKKEKDSIPVYDPSKKYQWKPDDKFYVTGNEFNLLLNATRAILGTKEAQTILLTERAHSILEDSLERAVLSGIANEVVEDKKPIKNQ